MADDAPAPAPVPGVDYGALIQQIMQGGSGITGPAAPATPAVNTNLPVASLLGEALGGGVSPLYPMSEAQQTQAGNAALLNFGINMLQNSSGPVRHSLGQAIASGLLGAQGSLAGVREGQAQMLDVQNKQQQMGLEKIKTLLPLLMRQQAAGMPNSLLGGGGTPGGGLGATGAPIGGPDPAAALPKDQALAAIVARESGGRNVNTEILDPQTGKPASTASGYYQMVDGTWQEAARLAGLKNPPPRAIDASRADQDAAASALYDKRGLQDWARSAPATAAPAAPAPYKVASTGATPPPPSGAFTAPATAADDTFFPTAPKPNISTSPTLRGPGSAVPPTVTPPSPTIAQAGPPTVTPPAQPTPQQPTQGDQPPAPTGPMTIEQYRALHPITLDPATYTVPPPDVSALVSARNEAARQLSAARAGLGGDPNKSLSDYNTAAKAVTDAQQGAASKSLELQQAARKDAEDRLQQAYNDEMTRQQQAKLKADELAQTAAENEKQRQAQVDLEKIKAGQTWHQKLQEQSAQNAQDNTLKPMAEQAAKAHNMNLSLAQLQPLLQDLPPGGGALGTVLNDHPELAPLFNSAGILNDKSADAVRLVNGLVANISTQMKPTGLGALREYEWDAFKSQLPSMLSTPAGQQKAIALLMNMNNRIGSEASWMNNYFSRKVPDDMSDKPGAMMPAHNLESDDPKESVQQRMDRELGPIVPSAPPGSNQSQWEQSLPPGKPYYKTWALPDPKNPGQPLRDQSGNIRTTKTLEVRPWQ